MKNNFLLIFACCFFTVNTYAQTNLNGYKYVIVPKKFSFFKQADKYRLNGLTHFLFNKYGFQAFIEGEPYPKDLIFSACNVLHADVIKASNMFTTKLKTILKDCHGKVVYTSVLGLSKEKEFNKSYTEALRNSFKSIQALNYKYNSKLDKGLLQQNKLSLETHKQPKEALKAPLKQSLPIGVPISVSSKSQQIFNPDEVLKASSAKNGYQLVNSNNKVVYTILTTSLPSTYLVANKNGILHFVDKKWVLEYYDNGIRKYKVLDIKF